MSWTRYVWRKDQIHTKIWLEYMFNWEDKIKTGGMSSHKIFDMGACLLWKLK
jgi:hypothetical protein